MGENTLREVVEAALEAGSNDRDRSRAEFVHTILGGAILAGKFGGGERVREEEVAQLLGVSRTPVREALRRLQSQGLLEPRTGRGLCVVALGRQQILELYEMREVLEGAAARLAARHASDSEIGLLEELLDACSVAEDDPDRLASVNRLLHHAIYDASHNRYLLSALQSIYDSMALLGATTFTVPGRSKTANQEHRAIVQAIATRAPEAAETVARSHIERAKETRLKMLVGSDPAPAGLARR
jgi:DNA-binding GntR family transcriptional regulator